MPLPEDSNSAQDSAKRSEAPLTVEIPPQQHESTAGPSTEGLASPSTAADESTAQDGQKPRLSSADVDNRYTPSGQDLPVSSWSASSEKQLGSPTGDRVFPIRSVVSVDPAQTPSVFQTRNSGELPSDYFPTSGPDGRASQNRQRQQSISEADGGPRTAKRDGQGSHGERRSRGERKSLDLTQPRDLYGGGSRMQLFKSDGGSEQSNERTDSASFYGVAKTKSTGSASGDQESISGLVTVRFKHIITDEGHAVITGRDGDVLQRCEDEPIHIPGAVQGFGLLIAMEETSDGQLIVRIVSENSTQMIGYSPQELFKLKTFTEILSEEQTDNLLDHIDFIQDEEADPGTNGPEVFTLSIRSPKSPRKSIKYWCAMHINPTHPDLIICEFELDDDQVHPLAPSADDTPEPPEDTLNSNPTEEEFTESTHASSKPLRVLRTARKRKGEAAAMEVFNIMSQVQEQLASAPNLDKFLKILVGVVKELTGFHRAMIYQFDSAFNGRVVTELVDPRATKDLYKGLNFPASDIPKQARDLYKVNKVRLLYDRDLETARLVCRSVEDLENPLDLSFSYLRAMSPIHIKYLANMAVRSSMSISINAFNELWGLIACHSYGSKGMRVSFPIRKMCRLVGDTASRNIERLSYASRLQARKLINTVPTEANPSGYIIASSDDLLTLFDADFGLLSIRGETKILGKLEHSQEVLAMLEYLRLRKITSVITSQDITEDFPDLRYSPGFDVIAGLLLVPLSIGGSDFIVFFRKGQTKEVKWAGNPYEKFIKEGTEGYLEPRKSFKTWSEIVVGKCREWTEEQVETAAVLCLVYGKFIEVWRQKEAAIQSSQLTRLLLANSAHEVRTPLNAIINYLEIALEGALDQETRENLAKSHSASKSLIYVINDLLDLTKTEEGQDLIKDEVFDLPATIREATDSFKGDAKRKGLEYQVVEHPGVPQLVQGDQHRVRQIVSNLTANAMQFTTQGWVRIEVWLQETSTERAIVEIVIQDTGCGMTNEKLDALFRDLEQVSTDTDPFSSHGNSSHQSLPSSEKQALGLGLAVVARIVRNMDGQLRLKSEEGKGSRFVIQLSFQLPESSPETKERARSSLLTKASANSSIVTPPPASEGEVTLVDNSSSLRSEGILHPRTTEDNSSLHSHNSGSSGKSTSSKRSDVDRLIDAISGPLQVGESETEQWGLQRSPSGASRKSGGSFGTSAGRNSMAEKPAIARSRSYGAPEHLRSSIEGPVGTEIIIDNKTLLKAVRMPDEFGDQSSDAQSTHLASKVVFDIPEEQHAKLEPLNAEHLQILVAEDDPVNSRIIQKRLEKSGHTVHHTVNGEDCASAYSEKLAFFDVVLMDMQMPIVDGLTSTKMIRSHEKSHPASDLSTRATINGRVPIFAVSASLVERERQTYISAGFDVDDEVRKSCLYKPGEWEKGGWFSQKQSPVSQSETTSSSTSPSPPLSQDDSSSRKSSESGSVTPKSATNKLYFLDERLAEPLESLQLSQPLQPLGDKVPNANADDQPAKDDDGEQAGG